MKLETEEFFNFACEREMIRLRREAGEPPPWTEDPVLHRFRFCNVFREDDKTTAWFRENVRDRLRHFREASAVATVAFRWFNRIETGQLILPQLLKNERGWDRKAVEQALRPLQVEGKQLFTGAYLIKSPPGVDKLTGLLDCIDEFVHKASGFVNIVNQDTRLECAHTWLVETIPYLGRFMAYEVVTDLRHTQLLWNASDILTWASAGPGCARGISWLTHGQPNVWSYAGKRDQEAMLDIMQQLLADSRLKRNWPIKRQWEMREVEHVLCEFDKWKRGRAGQPLKRRFP